MRQHHAQLMFYLEIFLLLKIFTKEFEFFENLFESFDNRIIHIITSSFGVCVPGVRHRLEFDLIAKHHFSNGGVCLLL